RRDAEDAPHVTRVHLAPAVQARLCQPGIARGLEGITRRLGSRISVWSQIHGGLNRVQDGERLRRRIAAMYHVQPSLLCGKIRTAPGCCRERFLVESATDM